jgi:hypothetical protein
LTNLCISVFQPVQRDVLPAAPILRAQSAKMAST